MSSSLQQFDVFRSINDILQFEEYIKSIIPSVEYITYTANSSKISLFSTDLLNSNQVNDAIVAYSDPPNKYLKGLQSSSLYADSLNGLTQPIITVTKPLSLSNNVIQNLRTCTTDDQAANKYYVDQRIAMSSVVTVDDVSLEVSDNAIRIAAGAVGSGLSGGSGVPLSIMSYQPNITTVGTLTDLTVAGNTKLLGDVTIPAPTLPNQAATKEYVDANIFKIQAGQGLSLTENILSVNPIQTDVIQLGDLLSLTVNGLLQVYGTAAFSSTVTVPQPLNASDASTKSYVDNLSYLKASTGLSLVGNVISLNDSLPNVVALGTLTDLKVAGYSTFGQPITIPDPTSDLNAVNVRYLRQFSFKAGAGLFKSVDTGIVDVQVDPTSIEITTSNKLRVSSAIAGVGLSGGSGVSLSVNVSQPQITTIGTLNSLTVSGTVHILDDTYSTADDVGALTIKGGVSAGNVYSNALNVTGNAVFAGNVIVPYPTGSSNATSKYYVDSIIPVAGTGITASGIVFNVNSSQPQITQLGTLSSLIVSGSATFQRGPVTVPAPLNASDAATKAYVDAMSVGIRVQQSVTVATTSNINLLTITAGSVIDSMTLSVGQRILVKDQTDLSQNGYYVVPTSGSIVRSPDMQPGTDVTSYYVFVESGSVNKSSGWIVKGTKVIVGTSSIEFAKMSASAQIDAGSGISQTGTTISVKVDNYSLEVGTNGLRIASAGIGSGLQGGSGTALSVAASLSNVTSLGTLTSLNVSGAANFSNVVTVPTPTQASHPATKSYVDGLSYLVAGSGLTKTNNVLSVNAIQTQITQVGTLKDLVVGNTMSVYGTVPATSPTDGALMVVGGITGGSLYISGSSVFVNTVTVPYPTDLGQAANKAYVDDQIPVAGTGLTKAGRVFSVNPSQTQITTVGTLNSLHVFGSTLLEGPVTVPNPLNPTEPTTKQYVDSLSFLTVGQGLIKSSNNVVSVNSYLPFVTEVGTLTTLTVNGRLTVTGAATFSGGSVTVPTPTIATDASTKGYVDNVRDQIVLQIPAAGTGLTLSPITGNKPILSVNSVQPQITKVGTLSGLDVSGTTTFSGIVNVPTPQTDSNAVTKGYADALAQGLKLTNSVTVASTTNVDLTLLTRGAVIDAFTVDTGDRILLKNQTNGVQNGVYVMTASGSAIRATDYDVGKHVSGSFVFVASGSANQATGWVCTNDSADDIVGTSILTFTQFSAAGQYVMGSGIQKTSGNVLSVKVDGFSIEISSGSLRLASTGVGTGLSGGSGAALSVNASLPHVTNVGTLTSLTVSGAATFTGTVSIPTPTLTSSPVTKGYVDGLTYLVAGTGLSKSGSTLSVNNSLPNVTMVGTLTSLTVTGTATFQGLTTVPTPTANNSAVTKEYVDSQITIVKGGQGGGRTDAGTGLVRDGNILSVIPNQSQVTTVGVLTGLTVGGAAVFQSTVTIPSPLATTHAANKSYVDSLTYLLAGLGISKSGSTISVNANLSHVTAIGALTGLTVNGPATFNGKVTVPTPSVATDAVNKAYCDSKGTGSGGEIIQAGTGLTKTNTTLSVNAVQSQITLVGTLTGLTVSGNATFLGITVTVPSPTLPNSATTKDYVDSLSYLTVGTGLLKSNSTISVNAIQTLSDLTITNKVSVPAPINASDATSKSYVDSMTWFTAGTGLVKSGSTISINSTQTLTSLTVTGKTIVSDPAGSNEAASKGYVDSITWLTAGTGLSKTGSTISVSPSQTFTDLTVTGKTIVLDPVGANEAASKSYVDTMTWFTAGTGLTKTGSTISVSPSQTLTNLTVTGKTIVSDPIGSNEAASKSYVDSMTWFTAGTGLTKTGSTISVNSIQTFATITVTSKITVPTPVDPTDATSKSYVDTLTVIAGTGITKSGTTLSVSASQPQITTVGTLNGLTVTGTSSLGRLVSTDTTQSTNATTGSVTVAGGMGIAKNVYVGGTFNVTGNSTFTGSVTVPAPTLTNSATTKTYVDGTIVTAGTGLSKTGTVMSVNATLPNVTSLGTLTALTVSGQTNLPTSVNVGGQTLSSYITSIAPPYSAGTGLVLTGQVFSVSPSQTLTDITVSGTANLTTSTYIGTQTLADYISSKLAAPFNVGSGLTLLNNILSVNPSLPFVTSLGTLTSLSVNGATSLTTDVSIGGVPLATYIAQVSPPAPAYIAGTGLTLTGYTFSVNPSQPQVTSLGTLISLSVSGITTIGSLVVTDTSQSTSTTTGSVTVSGGMGIAKNLNVGGTATFNSVVTVPTPLNATDASTKAYVDGLVVTPGVGLTKSGNVLSVHSAQTQVTSVGTLTVLYVAGTSTVQKIVSGDTTQSTSSTTGSVTIAGGVGIVKNLNVGGAFAVSGASSFTGSITVPTPVNPTDAVTKTYVDASLATAGTGLTKTGNVLSVNASQPGITSVGTLISLNVSGTTSVGKIVSTDTTQSTNSATGAVTVAGGMGIAKNLFVGGSVTFNTTTSHVGLATFTGGLSVTAGTTSLGSLTAGSVSATSLSLSGSLTALGYGYFGDMSANVVSVLSLSSAADLFAEGNLNIIGSSTLNGPVTLGILTSMDVTQSTSTTSGAVTIAGGLGVGMNTYIGGSLVVTGTSSFTGFVTVPAPTAVGNPTTKAYVDALIPTAGTGLSKVGTVFSVNATLPHVTSLGTLTSLSVTGVSSLNTLNASATTLGSLSVSGISNLGSLNASATTLGSLIVSGFSTLNTLNASATTLGSLSVSGVSSLGSLNASATTLGSLSVSGITSLGSLNASATTLGSLTVSGVSTLNTLNASATTLGSLSVSGITTLGTLNASATTLGSLTVSGATSLNSLSVTGVSTLSTLNASGTTLGSLTVSGASNLNLLSVTGTSTLSTLNASATTLGSLTVSGASNLNSLSVTGVSTLSTLNASGTTLGSLTVSGNSTFTGSVTIPAPTLGSNPTTKTYVDSLIVTAGTGLTKTGTVFSVNSALPNVTSLGTLTSLTVNGTSNLSSLNVTGLSSLSTLNASATTLGSLTVTGNSTFGKIICTDTTQSTSNTTGALIVAGGVGILGNVYSNGSIFGLTNPLATLAWTNNVYNATTGMGPPTVGTRSAGTCISLWNDIAGGAAYGEYALGVNFNTLWYSVSHVNASHKWYAGGNNIMSLDGGGNLNVASDVKSNTLTVSSNIVPSAPTDTASVTYYVDPTTNKSGFVDSTGKRHIGADSLSKKGDMIAYSQTAGAGRVFSAGSAGTVLTADPSSDFGFIWKGVDINNVNVDPQMSKYCFVYSLSDQSLNKTGETVIQFYTDGLVDRSVYEIPISGGQISIKRNGLFAISANIDCSNDTYVNTTTVQWYIQYDNGRTGTYTTATDSISYTTHTNVSGGRQTVMVYSFINVTNSNGANVRVVATLVSGSSLIDVTNTTSNMSILSIPGTKAAIVLGAGTGNLTTAYSNVFLSTAPYIDTDTFTYVNGQSSVTIINSGAYFVYAKLTLRKSTGTDTTTASIRLVTGTSGTYIPATTLGSGPLTAGTGNAGKETISWWGLLFLNANDTIRIQAQTDVGTSVTLSGTESGIFLFTNPISLFPNMLSMNAYTATQSTAKLSSTWMDIPFQNWRILQNGQGVTALSNTTYVVQNQGAYIFSGNIVCDNPGNYAGRTLYGQILTSVDDGATWYPLIGSLSLKSAMRRTGVIVNGMQHLFPGTQIKFQMRTDGATTDNITIGDGTSFSVTCFEHITDVISSFITFGTYFAFVQSSDNYVVTNTTYAEKMRLTTKVLPAGLYRISVFGAMTVLTSGATVNVKVTMVGPDRIPVVMFVQQASFFKTGSTNMSQVNVVPMKYGISHFILEVSCSSANGASIQNIMIESFRLT